MLRYLASFFAFQTVRRTITLTRRYLYLRRVASDPTKRIGPAETQPGKSQMWENWVYFPHGFESREGPCRSIRCLTNQLFLDRNVFIVKQMDLHLVWTTRQLFWKPIPRFLLKPPFQSDHLSCKPDCLCCALGAEKHYERCCSYRKARKCALSFLSLYAAWICYENDFLIAQEKQLLIRKIK